MAGGSVYNVYNMVGKGAEWVESLFLPYPYRTSGDRNNPDSRIPRVVRGGSWASLSDELLTCRRIKLDPEQVSLHGNGLGFQFARDTH